jgi:hypothetical protein
MVRDAKLFCKSRSMSFCLRSDSKDIHLGTSELGQTIDVQKGCKPGADQSKPYFFHMFWTPSVFFEIAL